MLDESNGKNVEKVEAAKEPVAVESAEEAVKAVSATEENEAVEAAPAAERVEESMKEEAVKAPAEGAEELMKEEVELNVAEAAPVKEEPRKKGYHSDLDGIEVEFELQYREQETDMEDIAKRVTEDYARRGNDASAIELIQVYLKPTDYTAYYVINNTYEGKIPLF